MDVLRWVEEGANETTCPQILRQSYWEKAFILCTLPPNHTEASENEHVMQFCGLCSNAIYSKMPSPSSCISLRRSTGACSNVDFVNLVNIQMTLNQVCKYYQSFLWNRLTISWINHRWASIALWSSRLRLARLETASCSWICKRGSYPWYALIWCSPSELLTLNPP